MTSDEVTSASCSIPSRVSPPDQVELVDPGNHRIFDPIPFLVCTMIFRVSALLLLAASTNAFVAPSTQRGAFVGTQLAAATLEPPPLSPLTVWGDKISNIREKQDELKKANLPEFAPELSAVKDLGLKSDDTAAQLQYVKDNAMKIKEMMQRHGAVVFRDFDLMKTQDGFQDFYNALGMKVCLDPLHSVSARPTVDGQKNSPVYEAVNKESRKNFFIGTCFVYWLSRLGLGC